MNKGDIIRNIIDQNPHLRKRDIEDIINLFLEKITNALLAEERVEFRNLGSFEIHTRPMKRAKDPRTGELIKIADRKTIYFKCGTYLYHLLNKK